jgi:hypothetical protein
MECDRFRSKLSAYKDGELAVGLLDEISIHLRNCAVCRKELGELDQIDFLVRGLPQIDLSEMFASRVCEGLAVAEPAAHGVTGLLQSIFTGFLHLAEVIFELFPGHEYRRTETLDEFGDFPPLSLSNAYFQVIGH